MVSSALGDCGSPSAGQVLTAPAAAPAAANACSALVAIDSGPNTGANTLLEFAAGPGQPNLLPVNIFAIIRQVDQRAPPATRFYDYERTWPLIALAAAFAW